MRLCRAAHIIGAEGEPDAGPGCKPRCPPTFSRKPMNPETSYRIIKAERAIASEALVAQNADSRMYVVPYDLTHAWPNLRQTFRDC